ncbi:MAG: hypothetical protein OHK0048_18530 [Rhodoferax sp.]
MTRLAWAPVLEALLEAVWVVDAFQLRILAVNQAACDLLGLQSDALVGKPVVELAATPEDQFFWEDVADGRADQIHSETLLRCFDGSTVAVERRVSLVCAQNGQSVYLVGLRDMRQQRQTERSLEQLVAELRATLDSSADGILVTDLSGAIRNYNRPFAALWSIPEALLVQRDDAAVMTHIRGQVADAQQLLQWLRDLHDDPWLENAKVLVLHDGRMVECLARTQRCRGQPTGRVFSFRDITESLRQQKELRLAAAVFSSSLESIFITDAALKLVAINPAALTLLRMPESALLGRTPDVFLHHPQHDAALEQARQRMLDQGLWRGELWLRQEGQSSLPVHFSWVMLRDAQGQVQQTIGFMRDLSAERAAKERIEQLAYNDALTGLPNRLLLTQRAEVALRLAERKGTHCSVLFVDLDRFKNINDSMGHRFGDQVLVEIAGRLQTCMRETDTVCRLGGDEFLVFLQDTDAAGTEVLAQRLLRVVQTPLTVQGMSLSLGCSIGAAVYPEDGKTLDVLIQCADTAMYRVKSRGRGSFRFYQPQMNVDLLAHIKLDFAMRQALPAGHFSLHYQPQLALDGGYLVGAEALLRWDDPKLGRVAPGQFIGLAESSGFIVELGAWVLRTAVAQASAWLAQGHPVVVSVNVSALQFQQAEFVQTVAQALAQAQLPAQWLELELTESVLVQDVQETLARLHALAALGVRLAIDDFGTGYSSLAYLKQFPIHKLKIDRSFVNGLPDDESDLAIVNATLGMARGLRLSVVAEGVETPAQRDCLARLGCAAYQGFLCSPGLPAAQFDALRAQLPAAPAG